MLFPASAKFKRGATFSFMLQLPASVEDDQLADYVPTAQLRQRENNSTDGFKVDLDCSWVEDSKHKIVRIGYADTTAFPLGLLETDVVFTRPATDDAAKSIIISATIYFDILREITV